MPFAPLKLVYAPDHYDCTSLPGDERSRVILSRNKPTALVLFVHGFRGDALETWQDFDQLAITNPKFKHADLVFFGYDGYLSNVLAGASFLFDLLNAADRDPTTLVGIAKPDLVQARTRGYERIVLVAHSLGAVVCRWAMIRAVEEKCPWREKLKLLLFAPAHTGSDLSGLASSAVSGFPWLLGFVEAAKAKVPLVRELEPASRILAVLADRVAKAASDEPCLRACRVVVAEREIVVSNLPFPGDPCPDALRDTDHISICKPTALRRKQIEFLEELLP